MAIDLTSLRESKWPRAAFHLLPTQTQFLSRENTLLWLCGCFLLLTFGGCFGMEVGAEGNRRFPSSQTWWKFGLSLCSLGYRSVSGQIMLWVAASLGYRKNSPLAISVGTRVWQRVGLEAQTAFTYLFDMDFMDWKVCAACCGKDSVGPTQNTCCSLLLLSVTCGLWSSHLNRHSIPLQVCFPS